jgi:NitT/TauT family transport system substrate-binding protein
MITRRAAIISIAGAVASARAACGQTDNTIKLAINPAIYAYLPIFLAVDKGYFSQNGVELSITKYTASSTTQMPLLARGDIDIAPAVGSAALFNQFAEGFNVRLISALIATRANWPDSTWVLCRQELWDSGTMKQPSDMKGKMVDGGPDGSPIMFLTSQALIAGKLSTSDVIYSQKFRTPPDLFGAFRNKAVDILGAPEPIAAQLEAEGLAHRWLSAKDIAPWFQETFLAANPDFLSKKPDLAKRFLKAYLAGARDVIAVGPSWTPELLKTTSNWSGLNNDILSRIPGPVFPGENGNIDKASLQRQQQFWIDQGKVKSPQPIDALLDLKYLNDAVREMKG